MMCDGLCVILCGNWHDLVRRRAFAGCTSSHIMSTIWHILGRATENHLSEGYDPCFLRFGGPELEMQKVVVHEMQ